jgi:hypothetical protein
MARKSKESNKTMSIYEKFEVDYKFINSNTLEVTSTEIGTDNVIKETFIINDRSLIEDLNNHLPLMFEEYEWTVDDRTIREIVESGIKQLKLRKSH